jgi:hypothetical protein
MDQVRFAEICLRYRESSRARSGIGTLGEKTLHAVLKDYFEPNSEYHEVKVDGYFADIAKEGEIFEIQTRDLYRLAPKISTFLVENRVTVVHPIALTKTVFWMDPETGECLSHRKSSKRGKEIDILPELYGLRRFLTNEKFRVCVMLMDVNEYRILDGYGKDKKKRATKLDRYPTALIDEIYLENPKDYRRFLPSDLPETFTYSDFRVAAKCDVYTAQRALNILLNLDLIYVVGKKGRQRVYALHENS